MAAPGAETTASKPCSMQTHHSTATSCGNKSEKPTTTSVHPSRSRSSKSRHPQPQHHQQDSTGKNGLTDRPGWISQKRFGSYDGGMAQKRLAEQQRNRVEEKQRRGVAAKKGSSAAEQQRSRAEHKKRRREIMQRSAPTPRERGRAAEKRGQQRRRSQGGTRERWKLGTLRVVNPFQVERGLRCRGL